jgi:hypothetical protein
MVIRTALDAKQQLPGPSNVVIRHEFGALPRKGVSRRTSPADPAPVAVKPRQRSGEEAGCALVSPTLSWLQPMGPVVANNVEGLEGHRIPPDLQTSGLAGWRMAGLKIARFRHDFAKCPLFLR